MEKPRSHRAAAEVFLCDVIAFKNTKDVKKTAAMLMYKEIEASGDLGRWRGILIMLLVYKENSAM